MFETRTAGRPAATPAGASGPSQPGSEAFARLLEALRKRLSKQQFATWFQRTSLVSWSGNELVLGLPNRFYQEWFQRTFRGLIATAAEEIGHAPVQVSFVVLPGEASAVDAPPEEPRRAEAPVTPAPHRTAPPLAPFPGTGPEDVPLRLHEHYTFENFIVGPSNRLAYASAKAVAHDPGRAYNPLFLHGSVGLGKTHLLHAVCREFRAQAPEARICFLSCEEFTNEFVLALQRHDLERFRARFRTVELLVIDDIHFLAGKERTQEEFFHTFNQLFQSSRQIVVSSDAPPSEIPTLEERLVSRFKWGLVVQLEQPEMETRMAIVRRKAELLGIGVPNDVVEFVAENFRSNIRELEGALLSLSARAGVAEAPIDMTLARQALEPSIHDGRPAITIDDITESVAAHWQVKVADLRSKKRSRSVSLPRQVVMYLARRVTSLSLDEIGEAFGGRDHSTVLYAIRRIGTQAEHDPRFAAEVHHLQDRLGGR